MNNLDLELKSEFENLPDEFWDFKKASTRDLTHGLHNYPAVMVYPISQNILQIVNKYMTINSLMDPFMGSGTVLVEGMIDNIKEIYGTDLNPLSILISKVKTTKLSFEQLNFIKLSHIKKLKKTIEQTKIIADDFDNFIRNKLNLDITAKKGWGDAADKLIEQYFLDKDIVFKFNNFTNLGFWFTPQVIVYLQSIKDCIEMCEDLDVKNFLLLAFSETVRTVSNTRNSEFKLFRMKAEKVANYYPNVINEYLKVLTRNIIKMEDFISVCKSNSQMHIYCEDARLLNTVPDNSIDLVITSPPYGDSRTTVAYGQFSRLSLQWLDLENKTNQNITKIDSCLLGGKPYIDKQQWSLLRSKTLLKSLEKISQKDIFRANDVFSFYLDLDKCLFAISNKMKKNSYQFWVVGNRTVKLETLWTDKIITELAEKNGVRHLFSFGRNISNKVMPSLNSPTNKVGTKVKTMTTETIVVLKKE